VLPLRGCPHCTIRKGGFRAVCLGGCFQGITVGCTTALLTLRFDARVQYTDFLVFLPHVTIAAFGIRILFPALFATVLFYARIQCTDLLVFLLHVTCTIVAFGIHILFKIIQYHSDSQNCQDLLCYGIVLFCTGGGGGCLVRSSSTNGFGSLLFPFDEAGFS
jgi:hypothetical protein